MVGTWPTISYHLHRRQIRVASLRGGALVAGASSLAYFLGKLSYIMGDHCMDKFVKQVTLSSLSPSTSRCLRVKSPWGW